MTKEGKILKALSGFYYVNCSGEIVTCRARGNFRNENITPLVGDDVKIQMSDNNTGYVVEILERKNELLRPKVANIDYSIIVVSVKDPEFSSKLLNKTICLNENSDVDIIIIFTKLDLLNDDELEKMKEIMNYYYEIGYQVFTNSEEDIDKLKEVIEEVDNEAFILITDAQEVIGKGFTTPVVPTPIENLVKECKDNAHYVEHKD